MYNSYPKGSEGYYAMQEAIGTHQQLEDAEGAVETTLEDLVSRIDELDGQCTETEAERDDLQKELDELQEKYTDLHAASHEMIDMLSQMKLLAEKMNRWSTSRLVALGALNETQSTDDSGGDSGDGGDQGSGDANDGSSSTPGITRPQIP